MVGPRRRPAGNESGADDCFKAACGFARIAVSMAWRCEAASGSAVLNKLLYTVRTRRARLATVDSNPLLEGEGTLEWHPSPEGEETLDRRLSGAPPRRAGSPVGRWS